MALFINPENFLDLWLRLQDEVLRASAPNDQDRALAFPLGLEYDRGRLVHVSRYVEAQLAPGQGLFGHIHLRHAVGPKEFAITLTVIVAAAVYPLLLFGSGGLTLAEARGAFRRRRGDPPEGPADLP